MKTKLFSFVLVALMALSSVSASAQKDTLRILAIGNSFSWNAVEQNLHGIADADGKCAIIGNMYIGGCSLERHFQNSSTDAKAYSYRKINAYGVKTVQGGWSISQALADEKWDVVTFQQASHFSGKSETYEPYLSSLIQYVKARAPQAKLYFHQTWAYAATSGHKAFPDYNSNQENMYNLIMFASGKACREHYLPVIPSGTAIQNIRGSFVGDKVTVPDGFHLNELGRYTAACTWYETLWGKKVVGNSFAPQYITAEEREAAQKAAHAAVRKPYKVSDI